MSALLIDNLSLAFLGSHEANALDEVSLSVERGEIRGLIGESGSGKSALALAILGLHPRGRIRMAASRFEVGGLDLLAATAGQIAALRGRRVALVPQEPMNALNPTRRVGRQLIEVLRLHRRMSSVEARRAAAAMLEEMEISDPGRILDSYPFQLSGGQRQRILLALAFAGQPELIVADEPTTALDVSVQAQVLEIIRNRARRDGVSVLFITHDMGIARSLCGEMIVMRRGRVVEAGPTEDIFSAPRHAYTRMLLAALPEKGEHRRPLPVGEEAQHDG